MKVRAAIILSLLTLFSLQAFAQMQKGIVRTIERPGRGVKYVDGATIRTQGLHNAAVSAGGGAFSLDFGSTGIREGEAFSLSRISKSGYELSDKGTIGRKYPFSVSVPLEIVLVNIAEREADKQRIADQAYARAEQTYKTRVAELEKCLADKAIDAESYRTQLQELQDKYEKYENLIDAMAERYASTDYAHIDSLNARVNIAIENGDLELADSLIRTVGPLEVLVSQNMEAMRQADAQEEIGRAILTAAQQDRDSIAADRNRLADLLYSKAQIHLANFENDSTARCYRLRAALDTTNVEWQLDAGRFIAAYLSDYSAALNYFHQALKQSLPLYGEQSELSADCYWNLGAIYEVLCEYDKAQINFSKALKIYIDILGDKHMKVALCHKSIGDTAYYQGDYNKSLECYNKILFDYPFEEVATQTWFGDVPSHAILTCMAQGNYSKALEYFKYIIRQRIKIDDEEDNDRYSDFADKYNEIMASISLDNPDDYSAFVGKLIDLMVYYCHILEKEVHSQQDQNYMAAYYDNIGRNYLTLGQTAKALKYFEKALNLRSKILEKKHPNISKSYENIASAHYASADYPTAIEYYEKALKINQDIYGEGHSSVANDYGNIGMALYFQNQFEEAIEYYNKAIKIMIEILGEENPNIAPNYNITGIAYNASGKYSKAIEYFEKSRKIMIDNFGEDYLEIAPVIHNIGLAQANMGDYSIALENCEKALKIFGKVYNDDNYNIITTKKTIAFIKQKMSEGNGK